QEGKKRFREIVHSIERSELRFRPERVRVGEAIENERLVAADVLEAVERRGVGPKGIARGDDPAGRARGKLGDRREVRRERGRGKRRVDAAHLPRPLGDEKEQDGGKKGAAIRCSEKRCSRKNGDRQDFQREARAEKALRQCTVAEDSP